MADYPISNVPRRIVYTGSAGVGPYAFDFEVLTKTDIKVYKNDVLLTLTTNYTVTISPTLGTGSITLVSAATGTDRITIVGARPVERTTDFTTGGDFFANTLNDEMDSQTILVQQVSETAERSIKAPVTDPTDINMTLPKNTDRAGKFLGFDVNGNPVAVAGTGETPAVQNMAYQTSNNVNISGGVITGITDLAIADGGTGASTASDARTNLGLGSVATESVVPIAKGGTNNGSLAVSPGGVLYTDGSKVVNVGTGTSGQVLTSAGASAPTWGTLSASGALKNIQYFTTAGTSTYTPMAGTSFVVVEVVGGGGGGGASGSLNNNSGCGGGGGGYARKKITSAFSGVTVTVGAGGGSASAGGTSSFGALVSATGGAGGASAQATIAVAAGGTGSSGDINATGSVGILQGYVATIQNSNGGSSAFNSGLSATIKTGGTGGVAGVSGAAYGGGGGGAIGGTGSGSNSGGSGAAGLVIVYEYA